MFDNQKLFLFFIKKKRKRKYIWQLDTIFCFLFLRIENMVFKKKKNILIVLTYFFKK